MENFFQLIRNKKNEAFINTLHLDKINSLNKESQSFLIEAICYHNDEICEFLINKNIDINIKDINGKTALHYCAEFSNIKIAKLILEKRINVNAKDVYGNNSLWTAVFNARGDYDLVKLLLAYNIDKNNTNVNGKRPVDFAKQISDEDLIKILS